MNTTNEEQPMVPQEIVDRQFQTMNKAQDCIYRLIRTKSTGLEDLYDIYRNQSFLSTLLELDSISKSDKDLSGYTTAIYEAKEYLKVNAPSMPL